MPNLKLISPWMEHYNKLCAFFSSDPSVTVIMDEDNMDVKVLVQQSHKAEALSFLLDNVKTFGDVTLTVTVVPANTGSLDTSKYMKNLMSDENYAQLYSYALDDNGILSDIHRVRGVLGFDAVYIIFKKEVIQYFTDNLGDYNGVKSTLAEYIARDIFNGHTGVFFSTKLFCGGGEDT